MENETKKSHILQSVLGFFFSVKKVVGYSSLRIGRLGVHSVENPELIQRILVGDSAHFKVPDLISKTGRSMAGSAMIIEEGEAWKSIHDILSACFTPQAVEKNIIPIVIQECNAMLARWTKDGSVKSVEKEIHAMTGRVIMRAIFGDDIDHQTSDYVISEFSKILNGMQGDTGDSKVSKFKNAPYTQIARFAISAALRIIGTPSDLSMQIPKKTREAINSVNELVYGFIKKRRQMEKQPDDIMGALINARLPNGKELDDDIIKSQIVMTILTGHETVASALTFALYETLKNNNVVKNLRAEFEAVVSNGQIEPEDYKRLEYARNVVDETLRLHTVIKTLMREATENVKIGDVNIYKDDLVCINLSKLHTNAEIWEDPQEFKPERFQDMPSGIKKHYMPFGKGKRACLGINMALREATIVLSQVFNKCSFEVVQEPSGAEHFYMFSKRLVGDLGVKVMPYGPAQKSSRAFVGRPGVGSFIDA